MKAAVTRALAVLVSLVLFPPSAARAEHSLTDTDARARLEVMESEGVARDPFWAQAYWTRSRQAPTEAARTADLRSAIRFDPELLDARWELCSVLARRHDSAFVAELVETVTYQATSFVGQRRIAFAVLTVGGGAALLSFLLLASLAILKNVPRLHHALIERLRFLPREMRGPATILTLASPIAIALTLPPTAAAFWGILLGAIAVWTLLDAWERRTCITAAIALLVSPLLLAAWTRLTVPVLPTSYLNALWDVQETADLRASTVLATLAPPAAHGDPDWHASLALADRRAGRWAEAEERLGRAIEMSPRAWSYVNNLGNVKLLAGDVDGALEQYAKARTLAPREPIVRVNEAQAWVRKLEFHKADDALTEARRLGYHIPPILGAATDKVVLRDKGLDAWAIWRRLASGQGLEHALGVPRALSVSMGILFPFRPIWLSFPLFLTAWWVSLARHLPRVSLCATCGTPICRKCHYRALRRSLCADCHAIRREEHAPLKRQGMLDKRRRSLSRIPRSITLLLAAILPGSGHLLRGAPRRASMLLLLALAAAIATRPGVVVSQSFLPASSTGPSTPFAIVIYFALALASVIGTLRLPEPRIAEEQQFDSAARGGRA